MIKFLDSGALLHQDINMVDFNKHLKANKVKPDDRLTLEDASNLFADEGKPIPLPPLPLPVIPIVTKEERLEREAETPDLDDTPLTFGKHKGKTPNDVAVTDPHWLAWAFSNVPQRTTCSLTLSEWCRKQPRSQR